MHAIDEPCSPDSLDELIPLRQVVQLPILRNRRNGRPIAYSTVWRWVYHGVRGHHLEIVKAGAMPCTSKRMVLAFFQALAPKIENWKMLPIRSPNQRQRASRRAAKQLAKSGF
jgi:hypothetical protein